MILSCLLLMWLTGWITIRIVEYRHRIGNLESGSGEMKKDIKSLKKSVGRLDKKIARVDQKLDGLITFFTGSKIDSKR